MTDRNIPAVIDGPLSDMMAGLNATRTEAENLLSRLTDLIALAEPQVDEAASLEVSNAAGIEAARDLIRKGKELTKAIEDKIRPITDAAHKTHKATVAVKKALNGLVEPAIEDAKGKIESYYAAEEERRVAAAQEAENRDRILPPAVKVDGVSVKHTKEPVLVDAVTFIKAALNPKSAIPLSWITFDTKAIAKAINNGQEVDGWTSKTNTKATVR